MALSGADEGNNTVGKDTPAVAAAAKLPLRIASLDDYRGYAIFGMMAVNYLGHFALSAVGYTFGGQWVDLGWLFRHNAQYFSYADTIAPIFMFVVGMGFRLSLKRQFSRQGAWRGRLYALRRYLVLGFIGIWWGEWDWQVSIWDALLDIALAGILALPFIDKSTPIRLAAAWGYLVFYQVCYTWLGYGEWTMNNSIDGGPLGIFSWAFILLMGTLAMDLLEEGNTRKLLLHCLAWGLALSALGWLTKWPWGEFKAHWPFSQKGMTMPYAFYSTGIAFLNFIPFYLLADVWGKRLTHFQILGANALMLYLVHNILCILFQNNIDRNIGTFTAFITFIALYAICLTFATRLYRAGIFIKI